MGVGVGVGVGVGLGQTKILKVSQEFPSITLHITWLDPIKDDGR